MIEEHIRIRIQLHTNIDIIYTIYNICVLYTYVYTRIIPDKPHPNFTQVTLEEVRPGESPDGLTLGVTATSPDGLAPDDSPATLEHIPETWHGGHGVRTYFFLLSSVSEHVWAHVE